APGRAASAAGRSRFGRRAAAVAASVTPRCHRSTAWGPIQSNRVGDYAAAGRPRRSALGSADSASRLIGAAGPVRRGAELGARVREPFGDRRRAVALVRQLLFERRQVVLAVEDLQVGDELRALADEETPSAEQVAGLAFVLGIDVGEREVAGAEQAGEGGAVLAVVLGFAAVDGFHGEGVAEDEGELFAFAEVGEPVPGEHAFAADDDSVAVRCDGVEEGGGCGGGGFLDEGLAGGIADVEEESPGVQIDAGVVCVLSVVVRHGL